jgi:Lrp/AsnC family leucine-responsive transcriptional regulator
MDPIDYQLLHLLQRNGRMTQLELSREVGLSQPAVAERVRKLEAKGVITGYAAHVDPLALGRDIAAFVGVGIEHPKYFEGFAKRVAQLPEVLEAHRVAGQDSYVLKVRTTNTRTLDTLLVETLRTIPGVTRTHTTIVLTTVKESTEVHVPPELREADKKG